MAQEAPAIHWTSDDDGVVTLTIDDPNASVNTMNDIYISSMATTVERLEAERDSIRGIIIASAKKSFFAGGDLKMLSQGSPETAEQQTKLTNEVKGHFRRMEKLGVPIVATLNGTALGGGLEVALTAHHRIAADVRGSQIGLPEVTLGLLPGGGGIIRTVRMLGLQNALTKVILTGTKYSPRAALEVGLVDEVVDVVEELAPRAKAWIMAHPEATKPWDVKGFRIPGGAPSSPALAAILPALPANLRKQIKGAPMPAPRAALAAAVEGAMVDFDTASQVETRYMISLTIGQVAKNMINAFFFDLQQINSGGSRPAGIPAWKASKVGVIGAGMMGAAIAYVSAKAGIDVVLRDVSLEAAERGKAYSVGLEKRALERGRTTSEKSEALLGRILPSADPADFAGVDLVIEAVFENAEVKQKALRDIEGMVNQDAVLGSNTSTLPITLLSEGVSKPRDLVGIHFFSPVDKMQLVELVRGKNTSDEVLAKAFDYVLQIRKTPIVVNDARGFFTSRVIGKFIAEAVAAVGEGVEPIAVEQAALQAGYPAGPLQLLDELTLTLSQKIRLEAKAAEEAEGKTWLAHPSEAVLDRMVDELGRKGRSTGGGFYNYDQDGKRTGIWPGLRTAFASGSRELPLIDLQERMLFAEAIDTVRCLDDGVLSSVPDANIGSIYGIGFPAWTGGVLQYINQYDGGPSGFVARAEELALSYGPQFEPPASLRELARSGKRY
ncbi:3-hydroxyacyl-CoA dehydrogenase/enoyl-CoA hydratase/3-hydroxybutyryl-CoA epimerase [Psychromicrobium silvestre]|uniref:3-hydroxyacyl-CoA dehydrogenase/enoyl-CoA hydratase/3-hydroxybutyryl-CoA epimerase n=1 Tax=Psychromicrobium silvestre TaxID=1645614 RepID=A0A7Y9LSB1_9MICC|nr:3-hydroxyacyl-CoA dehydrogenase NAD-binding domain-containing protein [Psychromicrobium silvestre]NYE94689.1 3-hydroxyacyl-CoA dehydrogenase/enoyl-CoA hydratase/3-hydroxybutyryl-CoA epimerase [Psychromicrobium silvestre]